MRKWKSISLIGFIFFTIFFTKVAFGMSPMFNTFMETEAEFVKMEVEGSAQIITDESLIEIVTKLYNESELGGAYTINSSDNTAELRYQDNQKNVKVSAMISETDKKVYISFLLSHYSQDENINNIRRTVSKSFSNYSVKPSFSSLIAGKYDKEMTMEEMKNKASKVFKASGAKFVDGITEDKLLSLYGYVPGIQDKVKVVDKYVNLNIAMRYSKTNGCTYIWIGSPIIIDEY
jgi:hypothetical protein